MNNGSWTFYMHYTLTLIVIVASIPLPFPLDLTHSVHATAPNAVSYQLPFLSGKNVHLVFLFFKKYMVINCESHYLVHLCIFPVLLTYIFCC